MLRDITPRLYQEAIFATCTEKNTLVVLPTGMGKTLIAMMMAAHRLKHYPNSKILFVAPTKPLVEQHLQSFKKNFAMEENKLALFTGFVAPEKRAKLWETAQIIFSTPQGLENDVISQKIHLNGVSLIIFDEAHRAVGDYDYVFLAKQYAKNAQNARILALTASPGSDLEKITEVCQNLFIEAVEIRTEDDPDVKPYIQEVDIDWVKVTLPESFLQVKKYLQLCIQLKMEFLKRIGVAQRSDLSKIELLGLQKSIHAQLAEGERSPEILRGLSVVAEVIKAEHALELLETQGIAALQKYFEKLTNEGMHAKTKAAKNLMLDSNFRTAITKSEQLFKENIEHPKLGELQRIIKEKLERDNKQKIIVFANYRDSAVKIKETLDTIHGCYSRIFVGQAKKGNTGLSQKEQREIIQEFTDGMFQILIATSVAEEGLDIPAVDAVIFYEPVPSAIRHIQRRGRTGRQESGSVIVLITKNTRDEGYRWSAFHRERKMQRILNELKQKKVLQIPQQTTLPQPTQEKYTHTIIVDHREKGNPVIKHLVEMGNTIKLEQLQSADFVLSGRVGVEFKTGEDFVNSIIDGRLLTQMKHLRENFERPLLIVEEPTDVYHIRNIHANAIRGMLAAITISFGIPLLQTKNSMETASLLAIIAKREQEYEQNYLNLHGEKKPFTIQELQEYIVSSFPGIGSKLAKPLLQHFGSVTKLVNAPQEALQAIDLIGEKKASRIREVLDRDYGKDQ
ncbi:DEAD/DEAH box helicase [Candidatus Woesearchaeota archaeon]|nr:DEAD/DEAH box helicase [Candidatus Woesearchaeota archaeon]